MPAQFDVRKEIANAQLVANRLEGDLIHRLLACGLTAGLIAWSGFPNVAGVWIFFVLLNEAIEPMIMRRLFNTRISPYQRLAPYLIHIFFGASVWAALGLYLWSTQNSAHMIMGAALLLGTLIHVIMIYCSSRILSLTVSAPLIVSIIGFIIVSGADASFTIKDKIVIAVSFFILLAYFLLLLNKNLEVQQKLTYLAKENERRAAEDELTGLSNRRVFLKKIEECKSAGEAFLLVYIDLDRFKPLNDRYGHAVGDEVLKALAQRLREFPQAFFAARLGGDEFGVLLSGASDLQSPMKLLDRIEKEVTRGVETGVGAVSVGASIGCARSNHEYATVSEFMHSADLAMMRAKSMGGGIAVFDREIDSDALDREMAERAFTSALRNGDIKAALQPIRSVSNQSITTYELLARWPCGISGKEITPSGFIPIAERLGLLNDLLWSTLEHALPFIQGTARKLAINISPSQLCDPCFVDQLHETVKRHSVSPCQVELEITEQVALRNEKENVEELKRANAMGFTIVLDDFGTGYSSISLLQELPVSKVKLDSSFVKDADDEVMRRRLLRATIQLIKEMKMLCCVEGVETREIEQIVTRFDCDQLQGYFIGMPEILDPNRSDFSDKDPSEGARKDIPLAG